MQRALLLGRQPPLLIFSVFRYVGAMIDTRPLFPILSKYLLEALHGLKPEDWRLPTRCKQWDVKDVAAHLLQSAIRRLSSQRDGYRGSDIPTVDARDFKRIVDIINQSNADWIRAMKPVSPRLLVRFLEDVEPQLNALIEGLDPMELAPISVAWAGETQSLSWFDIAREYTERWHHQQHIREAVGLPLLLDEKLYSPVLKTFMLALPFTFLDVPAPTGTTLVVRILGEAGGEWKLLRKEKEWALTEDEALRPVASAAVEIPDDLAWKLFTKSAREDEVHGKISISGDSRLAEKALGMVSVMA